jgi:hypothetical protein
MILVLQTTGILPWSLWGTMWRFWPAILILIGVAIVFKDISAWTMAGITLAVLVVVACVAVAMDWPLTGKEQSYTGSFSEELADFKSARVEVDFGAGNLQIGALPDTSERLIEGEFASAAGEMKSTLQQRGDEALLKLAREWSGASWGTSPKEEWGIKLSPRIPMTLDIDAGASDSEIDLTDLDVSRVTMDTGAAHATMTFPRAAGETTARIKAGAANITLIVPVGVAASISVDSGLSSIRIDEARFPRRGDKYESRDFSSATNKLYLEIDVGAATVRVQ